MKRTGLFMVVVLLLVLVACTFSRDPGSGSFTAIPDPETVSASVQLTLDILALQKEYDLARSQQDIDKQIEILKLIMDKTQETFEVKE